MRRGSWRPLSELDDEPSSLEREQPILISFHFIKAALYRRLAVCVLAPLLGLLAGAAYFVVSPPSHAARASLVLTSDVMVDSKSATATNISLLRTQTLTGRAVRELGLDMTAEDFLDTMTVEESGDQLLTITLTAPTDAEAVRRLDTLTSLYLTFRADQLSFQTNTLVASLNERIAQLRNDVRSLSNQIARLSAQKTADGGALTDLISQRATIQGRIESYSQQVEDATLRTGAVVASSRVLDPPAAVPGHLLRTLVLGMGSGVIGGSALGWGLILFFAVTSDRLRRRSDIATALDLPVTVSVGRTRPVPKAFAWLPGFRTVDRHRTEARRRLARVIESELLRSAPSGGIAVAGVDNVEELSFAVAEVANTLTTRGCPVTVIDLTQRGSRHLRGALPTPWTSDKLSILRPRGMAALADQPGDLRTMGQWDEAEPGAELANITLILADLDPGVGASHLKTWADRVVIVASAGRSSAEKMRTVADQVRSAGLECRFAALVGAENMDYSPGTPEMRGPIPVPRLSQPPSIEPTGRWEAR